MRTHTRSRLSTLTAALLALAMIAGACTSDATTTASGEAGVAAEAPSDPATAEPTSAPTTSPLTAPTTEPTSEPTVDPALEAELFTTAVPEQDMDARAAADAGEAGSPGLGDTLFPSYGNGGYDVERYHITLSFDPGSRTIDANTVVSLTPTQLLSQFNLELVGYEITEILIDGEPAEWARSGGSDPELVITPNAPLAAGVAVNVAVSYNGEPSTIAGPAFPANGWTDFGDVVIIAGEPEGAAGWFPVNDHPLDKALYDFTITAPEGFEVAANGERTSQTESNGQITWNFSMDQPQASYLTTLMIGEDLVFVEADPSLTGIEIRHIFESSIAQRAEAAMEPTGDMIDYFSSLFGDYPFSNYGTAVVDEPLGFALETQTLSVFGSDTLVEPIVAHELAHQWFGNDVSVADWSDLWLNEGFANYAEYLWLEQRIEGYSIDNEVEALIRAAASLLRDPPGRPKANDLFSASVYFRGGLTLHALRKTIGDNAFFDTLRTYVTEFGGSNASTDDFIEVAERTSGQDLTALFDAWLYQDGLPPMPE